MGLKKLEKKHPNVHASFWIRLVLIFSDSHTAMLPNMLHLHNYSDF